MELDWLKKWSLYSPSHTALKDAETGREVSYLEFYRGSVRLAAWLRDTHQVGAGDRVAVLAGNELEYFFLFFALQRLNAILVPINYRLTSREVEFILSDCQPKLILCQKQFRSVVGSIEMKTEDFEELRRKLDGAASAPADAQEIPIQATPDTVCMILYTSGTTGHPKGALIHHGMLYWNSINTGLRLNLTQNERVLAFLPLFHTGGWNVLNTPCFHRGATVILMKKFDADQILQLADSESLTILFGVPTMMDMLARSPYFFGAQLKSVRYAIVGGEPMSLELIRTWQEKGIPIRQGYGLTEFGPNVFSLNEDDSVRKIGSIGFPNFYIEAQIIDDTGKVVPPGDDTVGELALKGPTATLGYYGRPDATQETIRDGWLYTGDLVRRDAEGYFYVVGRKKDMFISGAENVYPAEIEQVLTSHPQVHEAAVIGVPDARWGEVGKAFVTLEKGAAVSETELLSYCQQNLARYKVPKYFEFLATLPKGDSGKVLKKALRAEPTL